MKSTIKIFLTMLCVGLSANISADVTVKNKTIENALKEYNPEEIKGEAPFSLDGAAIYWAEGLVSQLTTKERAALAYYCLNNDNNKNANTSSPDSIKRILKQITSAEVPVDSDYTRALADTWKLTSELPWNWTTPSDIPIVGRAVSLAKGARQAITTFSQAMELEWPNVNKYLNSDKLNPLDAQSKVTSTYWQNVMNAASTDIKSKSFQENMRVFYRQDIANIAWDTIEKELIDKINQHLTRNFKANKLNVPKNLVLQIENAIDAAQLSSTFNKIKRTSQPTKQITQISTTTATQTTPQLPYLDRYLNTTIQRPYLNKLQNETWYNEILIAATHDYNMPNSILKSMPVENQKNLITAIIMPYINESAKYYSITPFTSKDIYNWLSDNWPPEESGWFSGLFGRTQKKSQPKLTPKQLAQQKALLKKQESQSTKKIQEQPTTEKKETTIRKLQPRRVSKNKQEEES